MRTRILLLLFMFGLGFPGSLASQATLPDISGTWRVQTPDGPQELVIRTDSSASFGDDTVRWRLEADSIHIALGDEWMVYAYKLRGKKSMTLSGGDLEEPMELDRIGPATALAKGVEIPPAPPADRRAIT
ncbi:MAG: hypothetical protein IH878_02895 [Gemmatimonadetes bacterium]|nr:hypothetical protein [Gemmatimonadota bacterium]